VKRLRTIALFALAAGLVTAHVVYWYAPRARAAAPEPGSLPARLLAAGAYDACFWVPYPHQNVGVLRHRLEDGAAWLAAVARVAGLPPPLLPGFGPFAVPPSREIAACSDLSGDRFFLVARVYPSLAVVARLAGKLADNPWLAGGTLREPGSQAPEEREVKVAWREGIWTVSSGPAPDLGPPGRSPAPPAASFPETLGIFRLAKEVSDFPTGDYLLRRRGDDLAVTLERPGAVAAPDLPPAASPAELPAEPEPVLLAVAGPSWPPAETRPLPPAAFALFDIGEEGDREGRAAFGPLGALPGCAVFHPPGGRRWQVPTQGLAGLITRNLPQGNAAGWEIVALDAASLSRAEALAPRLSALTPPDSETAASGGGRLVIGLWVQPAPAVRLVARARQIFAKVPLVEPQEMQRWQDWETLLKPLAPCRRISLAATQAPPAFRLLFEGCSGSARAAGI
jgi:hypothetical protein